MQRDTVVEFIGRRLLIQLVLYEFEKLSAPFDKGIPLIRNDKVVIGPGTWLEELIGIICY